MPGTTSTTDPDAAAGDTRRAPAACHAAAVPATGRTAASGTGEP